MAGRGYRDLEVWKRAKALALRVYRETRVFPIEEKYGLTSQMRRAAVSIPANIAEGEGRIHNNDFVKHLSIARGSLAELETELEISVELEFMARQPGRALWRDLQAVGKMLTGLIKAIERDQRRLQSKAQSGKKAARAVA